MEVVDEWWAFGSGSDNGSNHSNHSGISCPGAAKLHAEWVNTAFGECVDTPLKYVAFFIGLSSILCWLVAQAPQLVTNCRLGIADKALSFWFLLQWFLGDATNLIGALLTHQLPSQIITAVYFCMIDTVMMSQFLYYVVKNQGRRGLLRMFLGPEKKKGQVAAVLLPGLICTMLLASWPHLNAVVGPGSLDDSYSLGTTRSGRVLLHIRENTKNALNVHNTADMVGYIIGCISAVFYLGSRMPQIIQNFARCSVTGVSLPMFILAVLGNVTYSLGIFLYSVDGEFLIAKLPWLVGSVGTLCFDFTIFTQFIIYKGFGKNCHHDDGTDEERKPLLPSANGGDRGFPCLGERGSIQAPPPQEGPKNGKTS